MPHESGTTSAAPNVAIRLGYLARDVITRLTSISAGVSTLWIFGMLVVICGDITARALLNRPIPGVAEVVAFSVPACVFLAIPHGIRTLRYLRADVLIAGFIKRHPQAGATLDMIYNLFGALVFYKLVEVIAPRLFKEYQSGDFFGAIGAFSAPVYPFTAAIVVGAGLGFANFILLAVKDFNLARAAAAEGLPTGRPSFVGPMVVVGVVLMLVAVASSLYVFDLTRQQVGALAVLGMMLAVFSGLHLATTLVVLAYLGVWAIRGSEGVAESALAIAATGSINSYGFAVIPLFVLMGLLVDIADVGRDAFQVVARLCRKLAGGLGVATVFANAIFAAITGSSIASATVFTRIAVPQMLHHGYRERFAVGVVAGSSVLGMLIPPSLLLLVYGLLAEVSVGKLFIAAIIPGILLATAFSGVVILMARFAPALVMVDPGREAYATPTEDEGASGWLVKLLPILALIAFVLGGIYGGIFTATEAGAVGAAGALVIALMRRKLTLARFSKILLETAEISATILILVVAANLYGRMLTLSAIPQSITEWVIAADLGMFGFLAIYLIVVLLMGMVLDAVSSMLLLLPLMVPIVTVLGGDLIWFGIVTVVAVEIGLITPPFGLAVFVVKGTLPPGSVSAGQIFVGVIPFVATMILVTILLMAFPAISLLLV